MKEHFEILVEKEIAVCATAALDCQLGDSHKHAEIKGRALGLKRALELYRKATRQDIEEAA